MRRYNAWWRVALHDSVGQRGTQSIRAECQRRSTKQNQCKCEIRGRNCLYCRRGASLCFLSGSQVELWVLSNWVGVKPISPFMWFGLTAGGKSLPNVNSRNLQLFFCSPATSLASPFSFIEIHKGSKNMNRSRRSTTEVQPQSLQTWRFCFFIFYLCVSKNCQSEMNICSSNSHIKVSSA